MDADDTVDTVDESDTVDTEDMLFMFFAVVDESLLLLSCLLLVGIVDGKEYYCDRLRFKSDLVLICLSMEDVREGTNRRRRQRFNKKQHESIQ